MVMRDFVLLGLGVVEARRELSDPEALWLSRLLTGFIDIDRPIGLSLPLIASHVCARILFADADLGDGLDPGDGLREADSVIIGGGGIDPCRSFRASRLLPCDDTQLENLGEKPLMTSPAMLCACDDEGPPVRMDRLMARVVLLSLLPLEENPTRTGGKFMLDDRDEDVTSPSAVRARALLREDPAVPPRPGPRSGAPDKFRNDSMLSSGRAVGGPCGAAAASSKCVDPRLEPRRRPRHHEQSKRGDAESGKALHWQRWPLSVCLCVTFAADAKDLTPT